MRRARTPSCRSECPSGRNLCYGRSAGPRVRVCVCVRLGDVCVCVCVCVCLCARVWHAANRPMMTETEAFI